MRSLSLEQGSRYMWAASTTDGRALQSPDKSTRIAATYYDPNQIRLRVSFTAAIQRESRALRGRLGLHHAPRDDLVNGQTAVLSGAFNEGAWVSFPISVSRGWNSHDHGHSVGWGQRGAVRRLPGVSDSDRS